LRTDPIAVPPGFSQEARGAMAVVRRAVVGARYAPHSQLALLDGVVGLVIAPRGRLIRALAFTVAGGRITEIDVIADTDRLRRLEVAVLER
ncbi:MAG: hypothetical protein WBW80_09625, partial [Acidimicrobiales bacterium]